METRSRSVRAVARIAVALAAVVWLGGAPGAGAEEAGARLTVAEGSVEIGSGTPPTWRPAAVGDVVRGGDAVRTGRGARAELALGSATVRLFESSLVRVPAGAFEPAGANAVELEQGESLFDVVRGRLRDTFEVRTPEVVVSVKGTRFGVAVEDALAAVSVYRGLVGVRAPDSGMDAEVLVREGFAAFGGAAHPVELLAVPGADPWSAWQAGEARLPLPEILRRGAAEHRIEAAREAAREAVARTVRSGGRPEQSDAVLEPMIRARQPRGEEGSPKSQPPASAEELGGATGENVEHHVERLLERQGRKGRPPVEAVAVERLVEEALQPPAGGGGGGAGAPNLPFQMEVITSGGPNAIRFLDAAGNLIHQVDANDVDAVLDDGQIDRLGPLLPLLQSNELDPVTFTEKLDDLI